MLYLRMFVSCLCEGSAGSALFPLALLPSAFCCIEKIAQETRYKRRALLQKLRAQRLSNAPLT